MTCFRMDNGQTMWRFCMENGIPYNTVWRYLERGFDVNTSIKIARERKGKKANHVKYFDEQGRTLHSTLSRNEYAVALRKIEKQEREKGVCK